KGEPLQTLPWLKSRFGHLRVVEIRDTTLLARRHPEDAGRLLRLRIGAALLIGFSVDGRPAGFLGLCTVQAHERWDADLHLLLKLMGASLASGLERLRIRNRLSRLEESNALALETSSEGSWEFDALSGRTEF